MKFFIINSGSSSIKFQVIEMKSETVLATGLVERIGEPVGHLKSTFMPGTAEEREVEIEEPIPNHHAGMKLVIGQLTDQDKGIICDEAEIAAVGHRVVHGGEDFHSSSKITPEVMKAIRQNIPLAPLHNPANLDGIRVTMDIFPVPQVAVFDTAFHQTMPSHAYMYALPYNLYTENKVRRYGFHGTSHHYVASECARLLGKPLNQTNLVTCHLGNGSSITAVENGCSIDTSLGMTPLEGLIMGTRCGDIDPAIHLFLQENRKMSLKEIDTMLNKESGLKGLCGMNDLRDIHKAADNGDTRAALALNALTYRNRKYIASYMAVLGRVDGIVFTAGIGENDAIVRSESLKGLDTFGVKLDEVKNTERIKEAHLISAPDSKVPVFVIPTNEELAIARETADVLGFGRE